MKHPSFIQVRDCLRALSARCTQPIPCAIIKKLHCGQPRAICTTATTVGLSVGCRACMGDGISEADIRLGDVIPLRQDMAMMKMA